MNADGSGLKKIADKASEPTFSPDGSQIAYYHWSDGIYVVSADGSGAPGKKIVGDTMVGFIEWSHDGRLIAFSAQPGGKGNIVVDVVTPDGKDRHNVAVGQSPSWSPDDTQLVFDTCRGNDCGIFKGSSGGGDAIPIVIDGGGLPAWSPDGKKIIYQTEIDGQKQVFSINPDGSGKKQLTSGAAMHVSPAWSADGKYIYYRTPEGGSWGIWRMNADGSGPVKLAGDVPPVNAGRERIAITH
jgi:TolB protein